MKDIMNCLVVFLVTVMTIPYEGLTQVDKEDALGYLVESIEAPLSITKAQLEKATSLKGLNDRYKSEWVHKYISVEIETMNNGVLCKAVSDDDDLSIVQKDNLLLADEGSEIFVSVRYIPENSLSSNDEKEMQFAFHVNPETSAVFAGGENELSKYLEENNINDIAEVAFIDEGMVAVKFTVSEAGDIEDVYVVESSNDEATDNLLISILQNMPPWEPAEYGSGTKVKQEMILTAGNLKSCIMNLVKYTNKRIQ